MRTPHTSCVPRIPSVDSSRTSIEPLEARIAPAFTLALSFDATVGVSSSSAGGTTTFTAAASGANLSWLDIAIAMASGANVVVNTGSLGDEAGNILDLIAVNKSLSNSNGTSLTFESGTGANLIGDISLGAVTLSGLNSSLVVDAQHNVHLNALGNVSNPLASVALTAETGAITNTAKVFATNLTLSAATGIGTAGAPFLSQVSNVAAQNGTGGIFITNTGALTIGFNAAPFQGVQVTGASGDIQIVNDATVSITRSGDGVNAPGNVTIIANGATSNILTDGDNATTPAVQSRNQGTVTLTAGQDILLGGAADSNTGDVVSSGGGNAAIALTAGRDILVRGGTSVVLANGSTGAGVTANAGRDLSITGFGDALSVSEIASAGGPGSISLTAGNLLTVNVGPLGVAVTSGGGDITLSGNDITLASMLDAGSGTATLQQASTVARDIDLGLGNTAGALGLSTIELDLITAGALRIGRVDNPGSLSVTSLIAPAVINSLTLRAGGSILDGTGTEQADVIVANLTLQAGAQIGNSAADSLDFNATTLSASVNTSGGERIFLRDTAGGVSVGSIGTNDGSGGSTAVYLSVDNGSITSATVDGAPDIRGTTITLNVTGAGIIGVDAATPLEVNASVSLSATTGGLAGNDIFLTDTTGGVAIGKIDAGLANVTLSALNGSINSLTFDASPVADVIGNLVTINATGATSQIGAGNAALQVQAAVLNATSQGGSIALQQTSGSMTIGQVNAAAGNVTLLAPNGPIIGLNPNDGIAEVVGNTVTLTVTAPSNGNTGQIGFFTTTAQFFEVDANTLNASTNNSRLWIREIGSGPRAGVAIGSVNAGTNTAFLQVANGGNISSANVDGVADIIADTVNLRAVNGGSLGISGASPLEINAANLNAAVQVAAGGIHVKDLTGGLNVILGQTVTGDVEVEAAGAAGNLVLTSIIAPGGTATLRASGLVNDVAATPAVTADSAVIVAGTGIGTTSVLDLDVANLSVTVQQAGGVNVKDASGGLNVLLGQTADGNINLEAAGASAGLTLAAINAPGRTVTLVAPGTVNGSAIGTAAVTASNISITAGTGIGGVNPLEIDSASLSAVVQNAGNIRVIDTAGGLNVSLAQTANGDIQLETAGTSGDLTLTNVNAVTHNVTLQATGTVNGATAGIAAVTADTLSVTAGTGIGTANPLEIDAANLSAAVLSPGNLRVKDITGGINVILAEASDGDIDLEAAGLAANLTVTEASALNHTVTLRASGVINGAVAGTPAVTSGSAVINAGTGIGTVGPLDLDVTNLSASVQQAGDISIRDLSGGLNVILAQTTDGDINLQAAGTSGNLILTAINAPAHAVTLAAAGTVNGAATGVNAVTANNISITSGAGIGTVNPLEIDSTSLSAVAQGAISIKDTAAGLNVILAQTANGDIDLEAAGASANLTLTNITAPTGTVVLKSEGSVNDALLDGNAAVTAAAVAITAGTGIGTVNALETAVATLAFNNTAGGVSIVNTGSLTIASVGGLATSTNTGTTTTLTTSGSLTFAVNTSSTGALIATAGERAVPTAGVDNLIVNGGVTVASQSDLSLLAGDDVTILANATVSATGAVLIGVDFGNNDPDAGGVATLRGNIASTAITIRGEGDGDLFLLSADAIAENIDGAGGFDTYRVIGVAGDVGFTDSGITSAALGNDTFTSIERVDLGGDTGPNLFDATAFTGLTVLSGGGGDDTLLGADVLIQPLKITLVDVDGDLIVASFNKGALDFTNLRFETTTNGIRLQTLDLLGNAAFEGASLTVKATQGPLGDGFANIGRIDATGINLGKVKIAGDLGQIIAGSGSTKKAAIASLTVESMGSAGAGSQSGADSLQSNILGKLGVFTVKRDIAGATINVTGGITRVQVSGDLVGGTTDFSGAIVSAGKIGAVVVKGSIQGGAGDYSGAIITTNGAAIGNVTTGAILGGFSEFNGIFSDGTLGRVAVAGSVTGSDSFPVVISAKGTMQPSKTTQTLAIKGLNVGGSVRFADVLAGYSTDGVGVNADVRIGAVSVGGNWIASNLAAGVLANDEGGFGTADDSLITGGKENLISKIASIAIKGGAAFGTPTSGDHFGFVAEQIGKFRIGKTTFPLGKGAHDDIVGFTIGSSNDLSVREV